MQPYATISPSFLLSIYKRCVQIRFYRPPPFIHFLQMTTIDEDNALSTPVDPEKAATKPRKNKRNFRQGGAILAVLVCYAMVGINITLLSPSLTRIALDLGNLSGRQWIVTSYMITYLTTTPISGKVHT